MVRPWDKIAVDQGPICEMEAPILHLHAARRVSMGPLGSETVCTPYSLGVAGRIALHIPPSTTKTGRPTCHHLVVTHVQRLFGE